MAARDPPLAMISRRDETPSRSATPGPSSARSRPDASPEDLHRRRHWRGISGVVDPAQLGPTASSISVHAQLMTWRVFTPPVALSRAAAASETSPSATRSATARPVLIARITRTTLLATDNLATVYDALGRFDEAEPIYLQVIDWQRRVLGDRPSPAREYAAQDRRHVPEPAPLRRLPSARLLMVYTHLLRGLGAQHNRTREAADLRRAHLCRVEKDGSRGRMAGEAGDRRRRAADVPLVGGLQLIQRT